MNENSVLRLSLITGSGQSTSFKTNLRKIVSVVIFDNQNNPMTIDEIVLKIKDDYELIFTDREILNSINSSKNIFENINEHIVIDKCETNISKYKLTINSYQKLNKNNQNLDLEKIVAKFLNKNPIFDNYKSNGINLCELLRHFLYNTFNSNKQILMSLINKEYSPVEFLDFSNDEKKLLMHF